MTFMTHLFGRSSGSQDAPWTAKSAYQAIRSSIDSKTGRLTEKHVSLPDEEAAERGSRIRWAPGAMDGVFGHHASPDKGRATALRLAKLIDKVARSGDRRSISAAYAMLKDDSVLGLIDPVIEALGERNVPIEPHLSAFSLKLATESADRGPVKAGIALLGVARLTQHREVVETLGLHDEFTLYSAVALANMLDDAESALWRLACKVDGWGRIQVVERLGPIKDENIRHWLRTEGFRNSVLYEYLALHAAEHGKLREALERSNIPDNELRAAGEIISSMIAADLGPCAGMNAYADAASTCLAYLKHVDSATCELIHFTTIHSLLDYLIRDDRPSSDRLASGWSEASIDEAKRLGQDIIARPVWRSLIRERLEATDPVAFHQAANAAIKAGIDPFAWHWKHLQEQPNSSSEWFYAMQHINAERIDAALELAERHIPLEKIATGPADEMGLGLEFEAHSCLDAVLQGLKAYPGKGSRLIATGLQSPVIRNRNMALNALEVWDRSQWTAEIRSALERAREAEVDEAISRRMAELLSSTNG